jgi:hypothetical protein
MKVKKAKKRQSSADRKYKILWVEIQSLRREMKLYEEFRGIDKPILNRLQDELKVRDEADCKLSDLIEDLEKRLEGQDSLRVSEDCRLRDTMRIEDDRIEYLVLTLDRIVEDLKKELLDFFSGRLAKEAKEETQGRLRNALEHVDLKKEAQRLLASRETSVEASRTVVMGPGV